MYDSIVLDLHIFGLLWTIGPDTPSIIQTLTILNIMSSIAPSKKQTETRTQKAFSAEAEREQLIKEKAGKRDIGTSMKLGEKWGTEAGNWSMDRWRHSFLWTKKCTVNHGLCIRLLS
jgi:hypothetical protein